MKAKALFLRLCFAGEIISFCYVYVTGVSGVYALRRYVEKNALLSARLTQEKESIMHLEKQIAAWIDDDFYQERIAREQLHMGRADEIVYLTDNK